MHIRVSGQKLSVFPLGMAFLGSWGWFCPTDSLFLEFLAPMIGLTFVINSVLLWLLGAGEAYAGPQGQGHQTARIKFLSVAAGGFGPAPVILAALFASVPVSIASASLYFISVEYFSRYRVSLLTFLIGWYSVLGISPRGSIWQSLMIYPAIALLTSVWLRRLIPDQRASL
jgi:hypothetical protein